ncbi:flavin reductase family protein [Ihubacter sp. rT4E-8]|uniref:flavin reductase family protein n=1 Tax=unclassified Ihubacter TaxID=2633299 RepID=UPI003C7D73DC
MSKISMKPSTMLSPVPSVLVTCGSGQDVNVITIAWTGIINSQPPMTYVSVRKERHSHHLISESGEFVINLTTEDMVKAVDYCGVRSGRDVNKFEQTGLAIEPAELVDCPLIVQSPVSLECKVFEVKEFPSHDMFLAEIVRVHAEEAIFDEDGRIRLDKAGLLAYCHGEYFGIKRQPLGKFGYSVMKAKTRRRINREKAEKTRRKRKQSTEKSRRQKQRRG